MELAVCPRHLVEKQVFLRLGRIGFCLFLVLLKSVYVSHVQNFLRINKPCLYRAVKRFIVTEIAAFGDEPEVAIFISVFFI